MQNDLFEPIDETEATPDEIRRWWSLVMRSNHLPIRDRLRASEMLAKSRGMFLDRQEISGPAGVDLYPTEIRIIGVDGHCAAK